jgi:hypothetical protein
VQKALIDVDLSRNFCDVELSLLSAALSALMPTNLAVDALCCKEANLLTAVAAIKFMLEILGNENSEVARKFKGHWNSIFHRG